MFGKEDYLYSFLVVSVSYHLDHSFLRYEIIIGCRRQKRVAGIDLQPFWLEIIGDFLKQKKGSADLRKKLRKKAVLLAGISFHLEKPAASFFDITSCFFDYQRL